LQIRLIDNEGTNLGIMEYAEAQERVEGYVYQLVQVGQGDIPTYKMVDVGKQKYLNKKNNKKPKTPKLKEVQVNNVIQPRDLDIRLKRVSNFLDKNHPVNFVIKLRGKTPRYTHIIETLKESFDIESQRMAGNKVIIRVKEKVDEKG